MASVNALRNRLYLLASLPPKSGVGPWRQQRLPLKLDDTPLNRRTAAKQLIILERQLAKGTFEWSYWQDTTSTAISWRKAIRMLYRKKVELGTTQQSTWDNNYARRLEQVGADSPVTTTAMATFLGKYERSRNAYKELYFLLRHISELTHVPFPEVPTPTYKRAKPKLVPEDAEILEAITSLSGCAQWYMGMLATYGLRPEESDHCFIDAENNCIVTKAKETSGAPEGRLVVPLMEEWVELWDLRNKKERPRRPVETTRNDQTSQFFYKVKRKLGVQWTAYALRHAYARRLWQEGGSELDLYTAAQLMGHSVDEHLKTYRAHINPNVIARAATDAIRRNRQRKAESALAGRPVPAPQR